MRFAILKKVYSSYKRLLQIAVTTNFVFITTVIQG